MTVQYGGRLISHLFGDCKLIFTEIAICKAFDDVHQVQKGKL